MCACVLCCVGYYIGGVSHCCNLGCPSNSKSLCHVKYMLSRYTNSCVYQLFNILSPYSLELDRDRNSVTKKSDIEHRVSSSCVLPLSVCSTVVMCYSVVKLHLGQGTEE